MAKNTTMEKTHGLVPTESKEVATVSAQEIVKFLSGVKIDSVEKAAILFAAAKNAAGFMSIGAQDGVNAHFAEELPGYNAALAAGIKPSVDGVKMARSVNTREKYHKIGRAMDWAIQAAQAVKGVEA